MNDDSDSLSEEEFREELAADLGCDPEDLEVPEDFWIEPPWEADFVEVDEDAE